MADDGFDDTLEFEQSTFPPGSRAVVPLFPLPNVVLLPRGVLPLHIFEPRYRQMVADALTSNRQIAMALLRPGWEKDYYGRPAIEPVVCVGTILSHELLDDGRYNLLLQGHTRASVVDETPGLVYRRATVMTMPANAVDEDALLGDRRLLTKLLSTTVLASSSLAGKLVEVLAGSASTADVADLVAFHFLQDASLKQSFLADNDVRRRVSGIVRAMEELTRLLKPRPSILGGESLN